MEAPGLASIVFSRRRLDLVVELLQHRIVLGDIDADRPQAFLEFGLFGRWQRYNFAAALLGPNLAQCRDFIDRGLPCPWLQLARFLNDDLAEIRWQLVEPGFAQPAKGDQQR